MKIVRRGYYFLLNVVHCAACRHEPAVIAEITAAHNQRQSGRGSASSAGINHTAVIIELTRETAVSLLTTHNQVENALHALFPLRMEASVTPFIVKIIKHRTHAFRLTADAVPGLGLALLQSMTSLK